MMLLVIYTPSTGHCIYYLFEDRPRFFAFDVVNQSAKYPAGPHQSRLLTHLDLFFLFIHFFFDLFGKFSRVLYTQ